MSRRADCPRPRGCRRGRRLEEWTPWLRLAAAMWLAAAFFCGCATDWAGGGDPVERLHLIGTSLALDFDGKPGADGIGVRMYAVRAGSTEPIRITSGTLELLLFDGALTAEQLAKASPLKMWSYTARELQAQEQQTTVGTSYAFLPLWQDTPPQRKRVTVVARYHRPNAPTIYSAPFSVPLAGR